MNAVMFIRLTLNETSSHVSYGKRSAVAPSPLAVKSIKYELRFEQLSGTSVDYFTVNCGVMTLADAVTSVCEFKCKALLLCLCNRESCEKSARFRMSSRIPSSFTLHISHRRSSFRRRRTAVELNTHS